MTTTTTTEILGGTPSPSRLLSPNLDMLKLEGSALEFFTATVSCDTDVVRKRIIQVQQEAFAEHPYPCIRMFHHVRLMMSEHPDYSDVLAAGKRGDTRLIDIGCCMGTDVRKLAFDGYPEENLMGTDVLEAYLRLGHELYDDADRCKIRFLQDDIFTVPVCFSSRTEDCIPLAEVTKLSQSCGTMTHIYTGAVFHLFDESQQHAFALRVAAMLKRESGAVIFGRHEGLERAGKIQDPPKWKTNRWGHSPASWTAMWRKVFAEAEGIEFAETRVETSAQLSEDFGSSDEAHLRPKRPMLVWSVRIL